MNVVSSSRYADASTSNRSNRSSSSVEWSGGECSSFYQWMFLSSNLTSSAAIKRAATFRINRIIDNAFKLHTHESNEPMEEFPCGQEMNEKRGGFLWTWSQILLSNSLKTEHGIWLHSRLAVGQEGQIITLILFIWFVLYQTKEIAEDADLEILAIQSQPESFARNLLLWYLPPGWIVRTSMNIGCSFAIVIGIEFS